MILFVSNFHKNIGSLYVVLGLILNVGQSRNIIYSNLYWCITGIWDLKVGN